MSKPDNHMDELGAILDKYYAPIKLPDNNRAELIREIEDFYRNKIPTPPRKASELYPQDYVDGYTQAVDDITAQFNSNTSKQEGMMYDDEYAGWRLRTAKRVIRMTDEDLADIMGVSRPTIALYKKNPNKMTIEQLNRLDAHLKFVVSAIQSFDFTQPQSTKQERR